MGMDATSRKMLEECETYGYPIPYLSETGVSMEEINRLLQYFDDENCPDFFKVRIKTFRVPESRITLPNELPTTHCKYLLIHMLQQQLRLKQESTSVLYNRFVPDSKRSTLKVVLKEYGGNIFHENIQNVVIKCLKLLKNMFTQKNDSKL